MSNFMKAVVEEVLNGKKTTTLQKRGTSSFQSESSNATQHDHLKELIRPNYQNKNTEKRLAMLNHQPKEEKTNELRTPRPQTTQFTQHAKSSIGDSISQLKKVSLSKRHSNQEAATKDLPPGNAKAELIGSTKDGSSIWFFPSVHPNLSQMFHRATSGYSVAVMNSTTCYPSQLLLLNDWLNIYPDLKYHLKWNKASNDSFTLELYDTNSNRLEKIAKEIFQHISKRALAKVESYQIISPSAWISKQLGITKSVESIGIVEGLSYFNHLLVLDHFYKNDPTTSITIQLEQHYVIATGKTEAIKETLVTLKKIAEQI